MQDAARREKKRKRSTLTFPDQEIEEMKMEVEEGAITVEDFAPIWIEERVSDIAALFSKVASLKQELEEEIAVFGLDHLKISTTCTDIARMYIALWEEDSNKEKEHEEGGLSNILEYIDRALQIQLSAHFAHTDSLQLFLTLETLGHLYYKLGKRGIACALWTYVLESLAIEIQRAPNAELAISFSEVGTQLVRAYYRDACTNRHCIHALCIAEYVLKFLKTHAPKAMDLHILKEDLVSIFSPKNVAKIQQIQGTAVFSPRDANALSPALSELMQRHTEERQNIKRRWHIPCTPLESASHREPMPLPPSGVLGQFSVLNGGGMADVQNVEAISLIV